MDESTGEIFVLDWFRFNTFPPGPRQRVLAADLQRIESPVLRALVEKSIPYFPREGKERKGKKTIDDSPSVDKFNKGWAEKGAALGLTAHPGETWEAFKQRIALTEKKAA
ncbi:MAG: hypothetical protein M1547_03150 [Gammaproteobacteria bacterium]|nr:hypothetical protein [Gammaproteobacteria bacterium]